MNKKYYAGRKKSKARLYIESNVDKTWLTNAYHVDGLRYTATTLGISPWGLLRVIDDWNILRLGNSNMAPQARIRMKATISFIRRSSVSIITREVRASLKIPLLEYWPFLNGEIMEEHKLIVIVNNVVPKGIPELRRQDICQDILVAILEGSIKTSKVEVSVREFIRMNYRLFKGKYGPISIDRPIRQDGEGSLLASFIADPDAERRIYEYVERSDSIILP